MTRESKSAATIRRRRDPKEIIVRHKAASIDEYFDSGEEDPEYYDYDPITGPKIIRMIMKSEWTLFLGLVAFRIINALMIQTSFVPDEYWQSLEVAHNMAFGYGYMTWEWQAGLRGYAYPLLFAIPYKLAGIFHIDSRILLIKTPRLIQAVFAATGDWYLYKLSRKLQGQKVARWTLVCQLTSWFTFYCCTRTLTNSMETVLTTMALYYFPWPGRPRKAQWKYISLVGLAVVVRPTAAIVWIPLCALHVWLYRAIAWRIVKCFAERGFIVLSLSSILDRYFYGKWVYVHYNFLQFNVLSNLGAMYGSHPWHWYLSQGFAILMGSHVFIFILALKKAVEKTFLFVILWTIFVYSVLEHKEFRFLFPILPMCMHVCGTYIHTVCDSTENKGHGDEPDDDEYQIPKSEEVQNQQSSFNKKRFILILLIITNLPLALYTSLLHQRGTVDVMKFIHDESSKRTNETFNAMFLMPCHSTPYYSYVHRNVTMRFLTCEPNLSKTPNYTDEADVFYQDPNAWLEETYSWEFFTSPTHLIMFNTLEKTLSPFLEKYNYKKCAHFFHSHVPEGRVGSHVKVYCKRLEVILQKQSSKHKRNLKS